MTKLIFYISLLLITVNPSLSEIRELYTKSSDSEEVAKELYEKLENIKKTDDATLVGYKAASLTVKAKHENKIKDKKAFFKEGATLLEYIITEKPNNIELRLIRLSIQENSPKILKYKSKIEEDKTFIYNQLPLLKNKGLKEHIKGYVSKSNAFTTEEKTVISKL
ncbi:hypothetical protein UMM65_01275 [Aureibaculum sp. 2210JD6-5]|uniref:hypothetical protein n=1 Tax=Aureibaculum sp. 2210JD6-5 TaxID=3103957 RepID=UPI002AAD29E9|nr:hypothetical protein [Aureibaculum sp. 2210JD6-5]MDY7393862.1 hypothetical protein [Aureibaculum sp. 2210JD6-5]